VTPYGRVMTLGSLVGWFVGMVQGQYELALLSMSVLIWILIEWCLFQVRLWREIPLIEFERSVNGRIHQTGHLWADRQVTISVRVFLKDRAPSLTGSHVTDSERISRTQGAYATEETRKLRPVRPIYPILRLQDVVPENLDVVSRCQHDSNVAGNVFEVQSACSNVEFTYVGRVRAAGTLVLPGIHCRMSDSSGLFMTEWFVDYKQSFQVFPPFAEAGDIHPIVKRVNSIPQHGIHRLQRSGLGSELLELREYVDGDPPKAIAWKVSARRDRLMTRQYESEVPVRMHLFVDGSATTRWGGFGHRLLDQTMYVAASVARSAISVGDPVGAVLFDERGLRYLSPQSGEQGFYRLLRALAEFSATPITQEGPLTDRTIELALTVCHERYPEYFDRRINLIPWTWFPIWPGKRRKFRERFALAGVLSEVFHLSAVKQIELVYDDSFLSVQIQKLFAECGLAFVDSTALISANRQEMNRNRIRLLSESLLKGVSRARDNEVFVILADLLESRNELDELLPAVKMALGRHHRVAFVCPSPTFRRPSKNDRDSLNTTLSQDDSVRRSTADLKAFALSLDRDNIDELVRSAENIQLRQQVSMLRRELRRLGATVTCSGEKEAIRMILSEMELARTGRSVSVGGHR